MGTLNALGRTMLGASMAAAARAERVRVLYPLAPKGASSAQVAQTQKLLEQVLAKRPPSATPPRLLVPTCGPLRVARVSCLAALATEGLVRFGYRPRAQDKLIVLLGVVDHDAHKLGPVRGAFYPAFPHRAGLLQAIEQLEAEAAPPTTLDYALVPPTESTAAAVTAPVSDCEAYEACVSKACALRSGACTGAADCESWQTGQANACVPSDGRCADASGCGDWQDCAHHTCVVKSGRCDDASQCESWQTCGDDHNCALAPGSCSDATDCPVWKQCSDAHECVLNAGSCDTAADCAAWQSCGDDHLCATSPGRCVSAADCDAWKQGDSTHDCVLRTGRCETNTDCSAWQSCDTTNTCVPNPGRCVDASDCEGWQTCTNFNDCLSQPGRCDSNTECAAWQSCDSTPTCVSNPGSCSSDAECESWQSCNAAHVCALRPGASNGDSDCTFQDHCVDHVCDLVPALFDPNKVVLWGTLQEGDCDCDALATFDAPNIPDVGFGCYQRPGVIAPDGEVLYTTTDFTTPDDPSPHAVTALFRRDEMTKCPTGEPWK